MIKLSIKTQIITGLMLQNKELVEGDVVISLVTYKDPRRNKIVVYENKQYNVAQVVANGFVLDTEIGRWYFYFGKNGGAQYFKKVIENESENIPVGPLTEEEKVGEMGTTPYDILNLILKKPGIKRKDIIDYLSYKAFAPDPKTRSRVRNSILEALRYLDTSGYVELNTGTLDQYDITSKGLQLLGMDKPKYKMPEGENE